MKVVTRFAPSPTGYLHIGGARTALFNWLFARRHNGSFLLRIEDTDKLRSTEDAVRAILDGLHWLGLEPDEKPVFQSTRAVRHIEVAHEMVAMGKAYYCYASTDELDAMRKTAGAEKRPYKYDGRWRDKSPADAPAGINPVIRLKAPQDGETVIDDQVQGRVVVRNDQLDDLVLLRSDGSPTYMHAVVVDDHDMGITHIIRGDDHFTNAFRQRQIYDALGWQAPVFAHIPLIHGSDGAKMSKRHGAVGLENYRDMGFLPEAVRNYLLRLGWSHGDDEIISTAEAIEWFDIEHIGKSPSRFDMTKLENLNGHYLREADDAVLADLIKNKIRQSPPLSSDEISLLIKAMPGLKSRAKNLNELGQSAAFYFAKRPLVLNDKAGELLSSDARRNLNDLLTPLGSLQSWNAAEIETITKEFAAQKALKLGQIAQPLRAALTGSHTSPGIFEVMELLGRTETLARIGDIPIALQECD